MNHTSSRRWKQAIATSAAVAGGFLPLQAALVAYTADANTVAYYNFSETSGTTFANSGNGGTAWDLDNNGGATGR